MGTAFATTPPEENPRQNSPRPTAAVQDPPRASGARDTAVQVRVDRARQERSVSTRQSLPTKICVGSRALREEFEKLESQKGSSYPKISRSSTACKIPRIGSWIISR